MESIPNIFLRIGVVAISSSSKENITQVFDYESAQLAHTQGGGKGENIVVYMLFTIN